MNELELLPGLNRSWTNPPNLGDRVDAFQPSSTRRREAIVPARPKPPMQWTSTLNPERSLVRSPSTSSHAASKVAQGTPRSAIGRCCQPMCRAKLFAKVRHMQAIKFMRLHERHDGGGVRGLEGLQVELQIAVPGASERRKLRLAGAEGEADLPLPRRNGNFGDLQRVTDAGALFNALHRPLSHILIDACQIGFPRRW